MNTSRWILVNGALVREDEHQVALSNRAFRYGDGLFESIRGIHNRLPFLSAHLRRMKQSAEWLEITWPEPLEDHVALEVLIQELLERNNMVGSSKIRLTLFREGQGTYIPEGNEPGWIVETERIHDSQFTLNRQGWKVDVFDAWKKPLQPFSGMKSSSALFYVKAGLELRRKNLDEILLYNENGILCEGSFSNLFVVRAGELYTPSEQSGCLPGIMRSVLLQLCQKQGIRVHIKDLTINDLMVADEVFMTNAIRGIQWVGAFRSKRYFHKLADRLLKELNQQVSSYAGPSENLK